jgi:acyl-homoserine-lactone acylase
VRYAGNGGQVVLAVEQWYKMGKARNFAEWKKAMRIQGIPMFNTVYADHRNIFYVFNALIPRRKPGFEYSQYLPGDRSDLIWHRYLPFDALPSVTNPPSGFVQNCNSSPFRTTTGAGNPEREGFAADAGIHTRMTNRSLRSLELLSKPGKISRSQFLEMKWDRAYTRQSPIYTEAIDPVLLMTPKDEEERQAIDLLRKWDGRTDETSRAAMLAILTWLPVWFDKEVGTGRDTPRVQDTFRDAIRELKSAHGRIDPELGEAQKLVRGDLRLPIGGGPDIMNAVYTVKDGKLRRGWAGDSYVLVVEFSKTATVSSSIHQFGNSSRPQSPHYADQAPLFVKRMLRPSLRTKSAIEERLESRYRPGEEEKHEEMR